MATRVEWAERVARWRTSGLRAKAFAERERIDAMQLGWWRWRLGTSPSSATDRAPRFVEMCTTPGYPCEVVPRFDVERRGACLVDETSTCLVSIGDRLGLPCAPYVPYLELAVDASPDPSTGAMPTLKGWRLTHLCDDDA